MRGVSFAMQVLIVVLVILIVALVVLSIFGGGIGNIGNVLSQLGGGGNQCTSAEIGGECQSGTSCVGEKSVISLVGGCPPGQICCVAPGS